MKIAVYGIALNEEHNAEKWASCTRDADVRLICDTGSTDRTVEILSDMEVEVKRLAIDPFRFDVARNAALSLLPADVDYCISLDQDEELEQDWRDLLEPALVPGPTRINHGFVSHWADGTESAHYHERIHLRHGYRWVLPVHEKLVWYDSQHEETVAWQEQLVIHQYPDQRKDRSGYLSLLEQAIEEPFGRNDWKIAFFLGDEYMRAGRHAEASKIALRCLAHGDQVWPEFRKILLGMIEQCEEQDEVTGR
jgi:glycosyltransferase involved in cell wall biosynthesis